MAAAEKHDYQKAIDKAAILYSIIKHIAVTSDVEPVKCSNPRCLTKAHDIMPRMRLRHLMDRAKRNVKKCHQLDAAFKKAHANCVELMPSFDGLFGSFQTAMLRVANDVRALDHHDVDYKDVSRRLQTFAKLMSQYQDWCRRLSTTVFELNCQVSCWMNYVSEDVRAAIAAAFQAVTGENGDNGDEHK
jgi:hypothetical protein